MCIKPIKLKTMYDNHNYPVGADNENAPWNQRDNDPIKVNVKINVSLTGDMKIETTDYTEEEWHDVEYDDGELHRTGGVTRSFDDCDFIGEIKKQYVPLEELLAMLKKYVEKDDKVGKYERNKIIASCEAYKVDYTEVVDWEEEV